jgi:hypothetical protein
VLNTGRRNNCDIRCVWGESEVGGEKRKEKEREKRKRDGMGRTCPTSSPRLRLHDRHLFLLVATHSLPLPRIFSDMHIQRYHVLT